MDNMIDAPKRFFIDGSAILKSLKYEEIGLEYSNIPTYINA